MPCRARSVSAAAEASPRAARAHRQFGTCPRRTAALRRHRSAPILGHARSRRSVVHSCPRANTPVDHRASLAHGRSCARDRRGGYLAWRAVKGCGGGGGPAGGWAPITVRIDGSVNARFSTGFYTLHLQATKQPTYHSLAAGTPAAAVAYTHDADAYYQHGVRTWQQCIQQPPTTAGLRRRRY